MTLFDPARAERVERPETSALTVASVAAFLLQAVVTVMTAITMYTWPLSTAACANQCDYRVMTDAVNLFFAIAVPVTLLSVALTVILRRRGTWAFLPSALATLAITVAFIVADSMARQSIGL